MLAALTSAAGGAGRPAPGATPTATATGTRPAGTSVGAGAETIENAYEQVIRKVLPSIVQINTTEGLGSGVIYDTSGHIVTNAHVVGEATTFQVSPASGGPARKA